MGKIKLEMEVITLSDDDDDDGCPNQGLHREKAISQIMGENEHPQRVETLTRKRASDIQTSSRSTSSDDLYEMDNPPLKRVKTSPASSDTYTLPG